ncbi:MAG TPA: hypothetical protein PKA64_24065, partial [Myxococcota bacterium]|nr:hypothetical protein [Myxococcota bacterium]
MTEPHVLAVAASALLLFLASAALVAPRPVRLSGEEGFKRTLAHLLGGGREAARAAIPWHPLGRLPERKLLANAAIDGAPLPGEEELAAELRRLPG